MIEINHPNEKSDLMFFFVGSVHMIDFTLEGFILILSSITKSARWLEISWMQVNAVICKWEHNSFVYLALLVILDRIKMKPSKVKSIMWTEPTKTKHEIRLFIGVINFYHYLWKKLFYMLYPLRKLLG